MLTSVNISMSEIILDALTSVTIPAKRMDAESPRKRNK